MKSLFRYLIAYKNLLRAIENIGIAVVYGIRYYGTGRITHDNYVQFIRHQIIHTKYHAHIYHLDTMHWALSTLIRARTLFLRYILNVHFSLLKSI